jgi:pectate lyase
MSNADRYLQAVVDYANAILASALDAHITGRTPLFADGLDVTNRQPVTWTANDGRTMIPSNLASQQNLLRTLDGLTHLTGDARYLDAALAACRHTLTNLVDEGGLLYWGGHRMYDLISGTTNGLDQFHELKAHYPHYELLWQADPAATQRFIESFWDAHILDWSNLDMNRHGLYGPRPARTTPLWSDENVTAPVFFTGKGLTFLNTGSDLFYAGMWLHSFTGEEGPRTWSLRMGRRYVDTRDERTGLGGYQYSEVEWGDRAKAQFGPEYGERARESRILDFNRANRKFGHTSLCQMQLAETIGPAAEAFAAWACEDLAAYARHAYNDETNLLHPVLTDGARLGASDVRRPGYYTPEGLTPWPADGLMLWVYTMAARQTGDPAFWQTARSIARGNQLGDIGARTGGIPRLNPAPSSDDCHLLMAALELYRVTARREFIDLSCCIGDNILRQRRRGPLFVESPNHLSTRVNRPEPLALLHLAATLNTRADCIPAFVAGKAFFTASGFGKKRTSDYIEIYPRTA